MKLRIERTRTDTGYGDGWVVLNDHGSVVWSSNSHAGCILGAQILANLAGVA